METRDFNNFLCFPQRACATQLLHHKTPQVRPLREGESWREEAAGVGRVWSSKRKISAASIWQTSCKPLCLPAIATGAGRSLNSEHQYPVKNVAVNIIFLCYLIFSLSIICASISASDSNPLNQAQPEFFSSFLFIDTCQASACSCSPVLGQEQAQTVPSLPIKTLKSGWNKSDSALLM